ncbi:MAG: TRAFAC clade GTPase domain-containing protein, partial [Micromonosporaceae bacterium]
CAPWSTTPAAAGARCSGARPGADVPRILLLVLATAAVGFGWWLVWPVLAAVAAAVCVLVVAGFAFRFLSSAWRVYSSRYVDGPSPVPLPPLRRGSGIVPSASEGTDFSDADGTPPPTAPAGRRAGTRAPVGVGGGEPAFPRYLAGQVWRDYLEVLADTARASGRPAVLLSAGATQLLLGGWQAILLAPVWLAAAVGVLVGAAVCAVVVLVVSAGYGLLAGAAALLQLAGVAGVRGLDGVLVSVRRTRPACPHPGCYRAFPRPAYACRGCGAVHRDLRPGRYGVLRRVCGCGAGLPTSVLLGRNRLSATCPFCERPLDAAVGAAPLVHLPVVGGPAAGKSTYTHLAVEALGEKLRFTDTEQGKGYAERLARLREGEAVPRTPAELPAATVLDARLDGDSRCLLYLFDPPGEHYTATERIGWQRYLDSATGLLVIVDPLSLPGVRRSLTPDEETSLSDVTPSTEDPAHVIDRLVGALRTRPDGGRLDRVAVVVTKVDAMRRTSVGHPLAFGFGPGSQPADEVRDWLNWVGWGNPMRTLDRTARQVRYFASGLDLPPEQIAEPVHWLTEAALGGRRVWTPATPADLAVTSLATDEIPRHYRAARWLLLGALWLLTVAAVTTLLTGLGTTAWHLLA